MADPPPTTTLAPAPAEVKKVKLDFSCFEQRQTLTAAGILRQIGKTLKNPVSALAEESQVIYFYQNVGRCPSEDEVEKLSNITHKVYAVVSAVVALLPGSQPLVIAQNIGGPLLKMLADEIDGLPVDVNEANEVNNQILLLAKSIIAASPKDNRGVPIDRTLTLPKNTFVSGQSLATRLEGEVWRITHRQGRFYARRHGVEREVQYDVKRGRWVEKTDPAPAWAVPGQSSHHHGQERIINQLALRVQAARSLGHEQDGGLFEVTLANDKSKQRCIQIADQFLPVRQHDHPPYYEVYDIAKPGKSGYPVYLDAKNRWRLGFKVKAQQQRSGSGPHAYRFVSSRLRQAITETLLDPRVDVDALSPPTSQGIVRSCQGTRYLLLGEQVVKIDKHPLLPHVFMLGPEATDKILCRFDRRSQRFVLVPDEKGFVSAAGAEIDYVKAVREAQLRLKKSFAQQSQKIRYREGFRTDDFEEYRGVLQVDDDLRDNVRGILLYGLDDGELVLAGKYADAAWELREGVVTAYQHIHQVKQAMMLGDVEHPVLQRFHEIFAVEPESAEAVMVTLLRNIEDTGSEISRHISDNFSRIWLIDHVNQNVVGEVYRNDPLKRIFINLKRSGAYQHYKRYNVKCHFLCTSYKLNDDVATILHEASHAAINTQDFLVMPSNS